MKFDTEFPHWLLLGEYNSASFTQYKA